MAIKRRAVAPRKLTIGSTPANNAEICFLERISCLLYQIKTPRFGHRMKLDDRWLLP
jgi:hypothetical protein